MDNMRKGERTMKNDIALTGPSSSLSSELNAMPLDSPVKTGRMEYNFVNPSDPYTFIAEDFETAALVVRLLGLAYGAEPKDGNGESVPIFLFGGEKDADEWYMAQFHHTPKEGLNEKRVPIADALLSFMLGSFEDRRRYEAALAAITDPEKREEFIHAWQDGCSSLNNIGKRAHMLGRIFKERM